MSTPPPDQVARERIVDDLNTNLFVEAGAGAGKTSSLVDRIISLIGSGIDIDAVAAITFTEKAAAELRHRVRAALAEQIDASTTPADLRARFESSLDRLDHAPIGTLHAFARRLLDEFPIAAGLPPGFTVLDELESNLAFEERWEDLLDDLLAEAEPAAGPIAGGSTFVQLCRFRKFELSKGLKRVASDFHANWDLVEERVELSAPSVWAADLSGVFGLVESICSTDCPSGDAQEKHLANVRDAGEMLRGSPSLLSTLLDLEALAKAAKAGIRGGAKGNWKKHSGEQALLELRDLHDELHHQCEAVIQGAIEYRKRLVGAVLGRWVLESARLRAAEGTLEFHDLLVLARRLLSSDPDARRALHGHYRRLLLDEFQDTDPIQLAIAVRLASDPDDPAQVRDWTALRPLAGRLFIVGDPKQSIYRFRRADIAQYLRAADQVGAAREYLTANFRSSSAVIDWANETFGNIIRYVEDTQPEYHDLSVCRPGSASHGSVRIIGADANDDLSTRGDADVLRHREADDVATAVATALHERWQVGDRDDHGEPAPRDCRPGDITILLPARTSLPALEAALRDLGVPYRAENASVVYVTNEIRHIMSSLRAADDVTDELALVAALRTPLYGCSDVELAEWKLGGGRWNLWSPVPDDLDGHPVADAIAHLRTLAERSTTTSPADLVASLVAARRVLDAALDDADARDVWRRVRYVVEQARAWSDAGGHGLRRYLAWVALQAAEARAADTILPEHDHDAIRVMTIHAAKGLEFPITIVSGLTTLPRRTGGYSVVWPSDLASGTWALAHKDDVVFDEFKPVDEQMSDAERRRLLYVACTRAVDHLVVSLHRLGRPVDDESKMTSAELLFSAGAAHNNGASPLTGDRQPFVAAPPAPTTLDWADRAEWRAARAIAFEAAARRDTVSATQLAAEAPAPASGVDPGIEKEPVDLDLPPWQRGRYGTAVGRAVHAVLQYCDLRTGADIDQHAAAQCAAEGILGMNDTVAQLARSALGAPIVAAALDQPHHRELFVAAEVGDRVLEGYVDLFIETPTGGVIVDYKTDQWPDDAERAGRIARYRRQLAAYAIVIEQITGDSVVGGILVRCRPDLPAEEILIDDWPDAVAELRSAISGPTVAR